jgi:hypothetical protein
MSNDPWSDLEPPSAAAAIKGKRVNADIPWDFFWARGLDRKCLLVLGHRADNAPKGKLPKLKGIEIAVSEGETADRCMLVFRLLDSAHRDIFYRLCMDIVAGASIASSEKEAIEIALQRTWRWHHLLRGGGDGRLSSEEQKGLMGELLVLERRLLPAFAAYDAVSSWRGPLGAPKDFELGRICIEAKARRGGATPFIAINSEHQLDTSGSDSLFLYVFELDQAPSDASDGFTISDIVARVRERITSSDHGAADAFEVLLMAAGFSWDDDYSDSRWVEGPSRLYVVSAEFPRLMASQIPGGVLNVKYSLSLVECAPFLVADEVLEDALKGIRHGA